MAKKPKKGGKIKSVRLSSGKRVQIGSPSYQKRIGAGETAISGTGKNLSKRDIGGVRSQFGGYEDEPSTTVAKRQAREMGETLPYQEYEETLKQPNPIMEAQKMSQLGLPQPGATATAGAGVPPAQAQGNIKTTQPSPATANATPFTQPSVPSPYQTGFASAQSQGIQSPLDPAAGRAMVSSMIPQPTQSTFQDTMFDQDPFVNSMMLAFQDYMRPQKQRESLTSEYTKLLKKSGLEQLDTELMNMKNVIEGTEDDIRNEVTKAGGFATDSQVMALSSARNKQLIKNYNNLLETRDAKQKHLDTMLNLTLEDRKAADDRFDRQMNLGFQVLNYRDKMQNNARDAYKNIVDKVGYAGLAEMAGGDPYYTNLIEKSLGLGTGDLTKLAAIQEEKDYGFMNVDGVLYRTDSKTGAIKALTSGSGGGGGIKTLTGKPQSTVERSAEGYANRLSESDQTILSIGENFTGRFALGGFLPSQLQSAERQQYEQAQRNFITAVLRRESGASISPSEFSEARKQYFPQAGDKPEVIRQKAINRNTVINNFYREANILRPVSPGTIIMSGGTKYRVGEDGETLIPL